MLAPFSSTRTSEKSDVLFLNGDAHQRIPAHTFVGRPGQHFDAKVLVAIMTALQSRSSPFRSSSSDLVPVLFNYPL